MLWFSLENKLISRLNYFLVHTIQPEFGAVLNKLCWMRYYLVSPALVRIEPLSADRLYFVSPACAVAFVLGFTLLSCVLVGNSSTAFHFTVFSLVLNSHTVHTARQFNCTRCTMLVNVSFTAIFPICFHFVVVSSYDLLSPLEFGCDSFLCLYTRRAVCAVRVFFWSEKK